MPHNYNRDPLLTDAGIDIGGAFAYRGEIWYRTDRSAATRFTGGRADSCLFEHPENGGDVQLFEIRKIDMAKLEALAIKNIADLIDDSEMTESDRQIENLTLIARGVLNSMISQMGMDKPENYDETIAYMVNDVIETADPDEPNDSDFTSAFRRYLESSRGGEK